MFASFFFTHFRESLKNGSLSYYISIDSKKSKFTKTLTILLWGKLSQHAKQFLGIVLAIRNRAALKSHLPPSLALTFGQPPDVVASYGDQLKTWDFTAHLLSSHFYYPL